MRRRKQEWPKAADAKIPGARWPCRKNAADWEGAARDWRKRGVAYAPDVQPAYEDREQGTALCEEELAKAQATQKLKPGQKRVKASGLRCDDRFRQTLATWLEEITPYFLPRPNRGLVEGLNHKIQVLKRRCSGLCNLPHLFQRLFLDREGYRLFAKTVG